MTEATDDPVGLFGPDFALDRYAFYLIGHVDLLYSVEMQKALGARKLGRPVWRTLVTLTQHPGLSIGEIADVTLLKRSTLSRVVDRMAADGLVRRSPREGDNRIVEVHITASGRALFDEIARVAAKQYARATDGLSRAEIDELCRMLRQMRDNLSRSPFA